MTTRALYFLSALTCQAAPVVLTMTPSSVAVTPGDSVTVEFAISGLDRPPAVGSFDLLLGYDNSLLSFATSHFGLFLGNPALGEALTSTLFPGSGTVSLAEISLLSPGDLNALQPAGFVLASATFTAVSTGTARFVYLGGPVDDAFGDQIAGTKTPEPATFASVAAGLLLAILACRARSLPSGSRRMRPVSTPPCG